MHTFRCRDLYGIQLRLCPCLDRQLCSQRQPNHVDVATAAVHSVGGYARLRLWDRDQFLWRLRPLHCQRPRIWGLAHSIQYEITPHWSTARMCMLSQTVEYRVAMRFDVVTPFRLCLVVVSDYAVVQGLLILPTSLLMLMVPKRFLTKPQIAEGLAELAAPTQYAPSPSHLVCLRLLLCVWSWCIRAHI